MSTVNVMSPTTLRFATTPLQNAADLAGRVLLAALFLISGVGKIGAYEATAGYMASTGVPSFTLPVVIALEILGALAIIAGFHTRIVALGLAVFTLATAVLFHSNFGDQMQMLMFLKNVSIAGGFLCLAARGAGMYSLDRMRR
jgi:putative oxidoreductase